MFFVCEEPCDQCLFSKDRIVPKERVKQIIEECNKKGNFFVCHKSSIARTGNVCCRAFYDTQDTQTLQVAKRLNLTRFVDPSTGLPTEEQS
jgi:hypothetical protein